jgi:hypothetical protein
LEDKFSKALADPYSRSLYTYESGCHGDEDFDGRLIGRGPQTCGYIGFGHNILAEGIEAEGLEVTLYTELACSEGSEIATFSTNGCHVIPRDVSLRSLFGHLFLLYAYLRSLNITKTVFQSVTLTKKE